MATQHHPESKHDAPRRPPPAPAFHPSSVVRSRYFYSMLLEAQDMTVEQGFHLGNSRRHVAEMHGYGTVCGLRVEETDCDEVVLLRPGVATDCLGREIRVEREVRVNVHEAALEALRIREQEDREKPQAQEKAQGPYGPKQGEGHCGPDPVDVYLSLCYDEGGERPVQAIGGPEVGCAPGCQPSRTRHGFRVQVSVDPPDAGPRKITDVVEDLFECEREKIAEWLCDWITGDCWACAPDPCGVDHRCVGLARVRVVPGGQIVDIDNCAIRPLVLPTVLLAGLVRYAVQHVRRPR